MSELKLILHSFNSSKMPIVALPFHITMCFSLQPKYGPLNNILYDLRIHFKAEINAYFHETPSGNVPVPQLLLPQCFWITHQESFFLLLPKAVLNSGNLIIKSLWCHSSLVNCTVSSISRSIKLGVLHISWKTLILEDVAWEKEVFIFFILFFVSDNIPLSSSTIGALVLGNKKLDLLLLPSIVHELI